MITTPMTALHIAALSLLLMGLAAPWQQVLGEETDAEDNGLIIEVELETTVEHERNLDLLNSEDGNLTVQETEFVVGIEYEPNDNFAAEVVLVLGHENILRDPLGEERNVTTFEVEEALLAFNNILTDGFFVELGRLQFRDDRMWLYDRFLDAVMVGYEPNDQLKIELAVGREFAADTDLINHTPTDSFFNYTATFEYAFSDLMVLGSYYIERKHVDDNQLNPKHLGLRLSGERNLSRYWVTAGRNLGREDEQSLRGYGFDVGGTYHFGGEWNPSVTLGVTWGSGDSDPDDNRDRAFRQTGLQKNESRLGGLPRVKHYGLVFDPEISNLAIYTAGFGLRKQGRTSLDVVYHNYRVLEEAEELRDAGVDADLSFGAGHKDLGEEIDLVFTRFGFGRLTNLGMELKVGYFRPGRAFASNTRDSAAFFSLGLAYAFGKDPEELFTR